MLRRVQGRITLRALDRVSPLAVPVLLDIGKEQVDGEAVDLLLAEAAESLPGRGARVATNRLSVE
jgi:ATP-dependent helicase Lhr and Lhr-like helicase